MHKQVPRIPAGNILIGSTHTHSAPTVTASLVATAKRRATWSIWILSATRQRLPSISARQSATCPAEDRHRRGQGKIAYNYYVPRTLRSPHDRHSGNRADGKTIATLVNYAVHPEVLGNGLGLVSPDLVGPLCDKLEADLGGMGMFMNGAQGGMITADNRILDRPSEPLKAKWQDARTWEECVRIGELMASEAQRMVKDAKPQVDPPVGLLARQVKFPVSSSLMWMVIVGSPLKYPHNNDKTIETRMNLVNIGDAQILTIPGEALPNIGYYIKRHMKGQHHLLFGLTNDAFGYILTKVDFNSFKRYEYVSQTSLGEMTGEILIENALKLVEESPARPKEIAEKI